MKRERKKIVKRVRNGCKLGEDVHRKKGGFWPNIAIILCPLSLNKKQKTELYYLQTNTCAYLEQTVHLT